MTIGAIGYRKELESNTIPKKDGIKEAIHTNKESGHWVTASVDSITSKIDYYDHRAGGTNRVVGIYIDPLVTSGDVVQGSDNNSQRRFQNDLKTATSLLKHLVIMTVMVYKRSIGKQLMGLHI